MFTFKQKALKINCFLLLFVSQIIFSQSSKEKVSMTKNYDTTELSRMAEASSKKFYEEKNKAILLATKRGWKLKYTNSEGTKYELMRVSKEGRPIYYQTYNVAAAVSTRANFLHNEGGLGLNIEGQDMTVHVWDGGHARASHQEYDGEGGDDRFSVGDGSAELNFHAGHVMGTIISSGLEPNAKGMAPQAKGVGYDWTNDTSEATTAAANGMLLSNHSYGLRTRDDAGEPSLPAYFFGAYTAAAKDWDEIMYNAPYYLYVGAAGNDGNDNSANLAPLEGNNSYDKLTGDKVAKNGMVVANGQDAEINADGTLNSVLRNSSSSEGPTDDLRIKPDIMGNGTQLYSTYDGADDQYNSITGTSMASPNVTGSLLLLQQYYNESYGNFMRASTLKGLALHTADNVGEAGPDALTGWGLMNTKKAAETITKKGLQSVISEIELTQGSTYSIVVNSDGLSPLLASISWTDLPGQVSTGTENDPTPALVNDLDIRVVKNSATPSTFMPWKLTSVNTNEKEDNTVDPFERVDVENASGDYTITISHKGSLEGGSQKVSLIVTGVSSGIAILTDVNSKTTCNETEEFNFNFIETIGGVTSFSVEDLPLNATVDFSEDSLDSDGSLTVTFGDLDKVASGTYKVNINGQNGSETTSTPIELRVINDSFKDNTDQIVYPLNGASGYSSNGTVIISWENDTNAEDYLIQVSDNPSFNTILFTETSYDSSFSPEKLDSEAIYYWRVQPKNSCASGDFSPTYSFQTGTSNCFKYDATDFSMAAIDTIPNQISPFVPFNITQKVIVDKVLVTTDITHTYVGDMVISLEGPSSIDSSKVTLLSNICGEGDDINTTFDDSANEVNCSSSAPAISGPIAPLNNMSLPFSGKDGFGEWKLIVNDSYNGDGGQINSASITICSLETNTNIPTFVDSDIIVEQNSTYSITESDMLATTESESSRFQVYTLVTVPAIGHLEKGGVVLTVGDTFNQKEVSGGSIKYVNSTPIAFIDEFKVDITNQANGWLSNQTVNIRESSALSLSKNSLEGFSLWPNPVKNQVKIQFTNSNMNNVRISLFDLQGREILHSIEESKTNTYSKEINVQNVASGIYLLKVQQGNKTITKKILVSK